MPFRSIVAEPEERANLGAAFDPAWAEINAGATIDPLAASAARERLGYILAGLWKVDPAQDLAPAAVRQFLAAPEVLTPALKI